VAAFEQAIAANPGQVACFISSPYHHPTFVDSELPADGYWQDIERLCRKHGIVLIVDDVRCGFRLDLRGSHAYFGFQPDLVCMGKAIANGHALSAVVGTEAIKAAAAKVFHTGSYWFQSAPMAASLATLRELQRRDAVTVMMTQGKKLLAGLERVAKDHGYTLKTSGVPSMPYLRITEDDSLMLHQRWCGEATRRGAFFSSHHNWFVSAAHTDADLARTLAIADEAFAALQER
jgi:glutamate-1-semialdehyde 2,1-aminomutase